jgi:hypothetical protein
VQDSTLRIGGEWCWKVAPDTTRPTVTWTWDNNPGQTNLVQAVVIGLTAPPQTANSGLPAKFYQRKTFGAGGLSVFP